MIRGYKYFGFTKVQKTPNWQAELQWLGDRAIDKCIWCSDLWVPRKTLWALHTFLAWPALRQTLDTLWARYHTFREIDADKRHPSWCSKRLLEKTSSGCLCCWGVASRVCCLASTPVKGFIGRLPRLFTLELDFHCELRWVLSMRSEQSCRAVRIVLLGSILRIDCSC